MSFNLQELRATILPVLRDPQSYFDVVEWEVQRLMGMGRRIEVAQHWLGFTQLFPDRSEGYSNLALALLRIGVEPIEILSIARKAVDIKSNLGNELALATVLIAAGHAKDALQHARRSQSMGEESFAWDIMGLAYRQLNHLESAIKCGNRAIKKNRREPVIECLFYTNTARCLGSVGQPLKALQVLDDLSKELTKGRPVTMQPGWQEEAAELTIMALSSADARVRESQDWTEAPITTEWTERILEESRKAVLSWPQNFMIKLLRANALRDAGRVEDSLELYDECLLQRPDSEELKWEKAVALSRLVGNSPALNEALEYFDRCRLEEPNEKSVVNSILAAYRLGTEDLSQRLADAINLYPSSAPLMNILGASLPTAEEAFGFFENVILEHPNDVPILANYAWFGILSGQFEVVAETLRRRLEATEFGPMIRPVLFKRAVYAAARTGRKDLENWARKLISQIDEELRDQLEHSFSDGLTRQVLAGAPRKLQMVLSDLDRSASLVVSLQSSLFESAVTERIATQLELEFVGTRQMPSWAAGREIDGLCRKDDQFWLLSCKLRYDQSKPITVSEVKALLQLHKLATEQGISALAVMISNVVHAEPNARLLMHSSGVRWFAARLPANWPVRQDWKVTSVEELKTQE